MSQHQAEMQRCQAELQTNQATMQKNQEELLAMLKGKPETLTTRGETCRHAGAQQVPETSVPEDFHTRQAAEQANQFHTSQG